MGSRTRRSGRRVLLGAAIAVSLTLAAGCASSGGNGSGSGGSATKTSGFTIAYSAWATNDPYSSGVLQGLRQEAKKLGDRIVLVTNANNDAQTQGNNVSDIVAIHPDAVILAPIDVAQSEAWVRQLDAAGIKVFTLLLAVGHYGLPLYHGVIGAVQYNEEASGSGNANSLAKHLKAPATVGVLTGQPGNQVAELRSQGFRRELLKHGDYTVIPSAPGQYTPDVGLATCQALISAHPTIKAIYSESDVETTGCIKAPNIGHVMVLSTGGSPPDQKEIKAGTVLGTTCYLPQPFAAAAMQDLHNVLAGKRKHGLLRNYVPWPVTKANLASCPRK